MWYLHCSMFRRLAGRRTQFISPTATPSSLLCFRYSNEVCNVIVLVWRCSQRLLASQLQDCLGGNCKTAMIVAVSPDSADGAESKCSLTFAARVGRVQTGAVSQQVAADGGASRKLRKVEAAYAVAQEELSSMQVRESRAAETLMA